MELCPSVSQSLSSAPLTISDRLLSLSLCPIRISSSYLLLSLSSAFLSAGELLGSEEEPAARANLGNTGGWRRRQGLTERPAFPRW